MIRKLIKQAGILFLAVFMLFITVSADVLAAENVEIYAADEGNDWPFKDLPVNDSDWKYTNVKGVYYQGVMTGTTDTTFSPNAPLTRAMLAQIVYSMVNKPSVDYVQYFSDVPNNKWYSKAITWARQNNVIAGMADGTFLPNKNISREQVATILYSYAKSQGFDVSEAKDLSEFADGNTVSKWAVGSLKWAAAVGIISGSKTDGQFYIKPTAEATRAECAAMINKFMKKYGKSKEHEGVVYQEGVKNLPASTNVVVNGNTATFSGKQSDIKPGDIVTVGTEKAFKVTKVTDDGGNTKIEYTQPELYEVVQRMDTAGQAKLDFQNFTPADGVAMTMKPAEGALDDEMVGMNPISLVGTLPLTKNKNLKVNFQLDFAVSNVDYGMKWHFEGFKPYADNIYVKFDPTVSFTANILADGYKPLKNKAGNQDIVYEYLPIGTCPIIGIDGAGAVVEIDIVVGAEGKIEFQAVYTGTVGVQIRDNKMYNLTSMNQTTSIAAAAKVGIGPNISVLLEVYEKLLDFNIKLMGMAKGQAKWRFDDTVCLDAFLYVEGVVTAMERSIFKDLTGSAVWYFWDENNSPLKLNWHFENMKHVDKCKYTQGTVTGVVSDADTGKKISGAKIEVYNSITDDFEGSTTTKPDGSYSIQVEGGSHLVKISANGYQPAQTVETAMGGETAYIETFLMIDNSSITPGALGRVSGKVTDANTGLPLGGVKLDIRNNRNTTTGTIVKSVTTALDGSYSVELPYGNYTVSMSKSGYTSGHFNIVASKTARTGVNGTLLPINSSQYTADTMRVVLSWKAKDVDLDARMYGVANGSTAFSVSWLNKNSNDGYKASLDVDNRGTYSTGSETITVGKMSGLDHILFYVNDYDNTLNGKNPATALTNSSATVKVYIGDKLVNTLVVPNNMGGTFWYAFDYDVKKQKLNIPNKLAYDMTTITTIYNESAPEVYMELPFEMGEKTEAPVDEVVIEDADIIAFPEVVVDEPGNVIEYDSVIIDSGDVVVQDLVG